MTWFYFDPKDGTTFVLPANDATDVCPDITWMGIRKGGERWWALNSIAGVRRLQVYRSFPAGAMPIRTVLLAVPPTPGAWNPFGLTNDKKGFNIVSRDITATVADQFTFYDTNGNIIREALLSDGSDRRVKQHVFLEHDYYVLRTSVETAFQIAVYDPRGIFIRAWGLSGITFAENASGITTDGKFFYVSISSQPGSRIVKFANGLSPAIRTYPSPGDNQAFEQGITFNGRYIICRLQVLPPP